MRNRLLAILAATVLMLAACGDDDDTTAPETTAAPGTTADPAEPDPGQAEPGPEQAGEETVVNVTMSFEPATVEIAAGDTVRWENTSGLPHTVTSTSGGMDFDESLSSTGSVSITFDEPGTYEYECTIHPGMAGTVVVS
jgi:plastocyanin